jgi:diguanylate cyclase (GGDEF)-like protein
MPLSSSNNRLISMQWVIMTAVALLEILPRAVLEAPFHLELVGLRLGALIVIAFLCSRLNRREPELAVGLYSVVLAGLTSLDIKVSPQVWQANQLESLLYAVIGATCVYGLGLLWGARGMLAGAVIAALLVGLNTDLPVQVTLGALTGAAGLVGWSLQRIFHDMDEIQRDLRQRANTDAMTELNNRRALEDDFRRFRANAKRFGVPLLLISWDVDGLKRINDSEGHAAGDEHLMGFVAALRETVRQGDGLYRIGGDEFVSLHPGLNLDSGAVLYRRVLQRFSFVSAGWVTATNDSLDAALEDADARLYTDKEARRMARFRSDRRVSETVID